MKTATSLILSALVVLISFQKSFFLIDYQVNRAMYEALCENKEKPQMQCFGQCKLREKMEKKESETKFVNIILEVNMLPTKFVTIPHQQVVSSKDEKAGFLNFSENLHKGFRSRLLNPPRNASFA